MSTAPPEHRGGGINGFPGASVADVGASTIGFRVGVSDDVSEDDRRHGGGRLGGGVVFRPLIFFIPVDPISGGVFLALGFPVDFFNFFLIGVFLRWFFRRRT